MYVPNIELLIRFEGNMWLLTKTYDGQRVIEASTDYMFTEVSVNNCFVLPNLRAMPPRQATENRVIHIQLVASIKHYFFLMLNGQLNTCIIKVIKMLNGLFVLTVCFAFLYCENLIRL